VERVELEAECHAGFYVHYDNGQTAEVSWAFVRELPPKK
jgi:predicted metalloprotease